MKVKLERSVEQVVDGTSYRGRLKIGETTLDYEMRFEVPINLLNDMETAKSVGELRGVIPISLTKDGVAIDLTDEEYKFFFFALAEFVVDFFHHPQTRMSQEGIIGMFLRGDGLMEGLGARATAGMVEQVSAGLTHKACVMLCGPKFGCVLTASE